MNNYTRFGLLMVATSLYLAHDPRPAVEPEVEPEIRLTLPQQCERFNVEYDDEDWNPETETFPANVNWMECMGVGYRSNRERINPEDDVEILDIHIKLVLYDSKRDLQRVLKYEGGCRNCSTTEGISLCKRNIDTGTATCLVHTVRSRHVDDRATRVLGHEVWHGVYGRYHEEDY